MAIPTLAAMAALTLLQNPHMQPQDVTVNYGDMNTYASRVQRYQRKQAAYRRRAATKISATIRGFLSRANTFLGEMADYSPRYIMRLPPIRESLGTRPSRELDYGDRPRMWYNADRLYWMRRDYVRRRL